MGEVEPTSVIGLVQWALGYSSQALLGMLLIGSFVLIWKFCNLQFGSMANVVREQAAVSASVTAAIKTIDADIQSLRTEVAQVKKILEADR